MIEQLLALADVLPEAKWNVLRRGAASHSLDDEAANRAGLLPVEAARLDDLRRAAGGRTDRELDDGMRAAYGAFARRAVCEIVWTGTRLPATSLLRGTMAMASSIVGNAREHIVVAGFVVDPEILNQLGCPSALRRGVALTVLSEKVDWGNAALQSLAAAGARFFEAKPLGDGIDKFHVKAIVADGDVALIGSANFTHLGQSKNAELGVCVRGGPAAATMQLMLEYAEYLGSRREA